MKSEAEREEIDEAERKAKKRRLLGMGLAGGGQVNMFKLVQVCFHGDSNEFGAETYTVLLLLLCFYFPQQSPL